MERERPERAGKALRFFVQDATFAWLLLLLIILSGALIIGALVKENYPDLAIPQALVSTEWPGGDPNNLEQQVTAKIERKLKGLAGLKRLRSASVAGYSIIAAEFAAGADMDESMNELRSAVDQALPDLPKEAKRPVITKMSVNLTPILTVNLHGDVPPNLMAAAARRLKDRMEQVAGVRKVDLSGHRDEVLHVLLKPDRLMSLSLSSDQVVAAIQSSHWDLPLGQITGGGIGSQFRLLGRFRTAKDLASLPVIRKGARPITLGEVAEVRRDLARVKELTRLSYKNSRFTPTVTLDAQRAVGADALTVIASLKAALKQFSQGPDFPPGLALSITSDESEPILESLSSVFNNGWQAVLVVFAILLATLGIREAVLAGLAIPVTFLAAFAALPLLDYTVNQMVIVGMVLALGMLVDNFILVMEGVHDHLAKGLPAGTAALATFRQYAGPAFSGTLTTILAMLPLAFLGGVDGKFMRLIPVTASLCMLASYLIAMLVVLPISRLAMKGVKPRPTKIDLVTQKAQKRFEPWLRERVLGSRRAIWLWLGSGVALLALSLAAAGLIKVIMYPQSDSRPLGITVELPPETSLERADRVARALGQVLRQKRYLESVVAFTGRKSPMAKNSIGEELSPSQAPYLVGFSATFLPRDQRERDSSAYLPGLRNELAEALAQSHPGGLMSLSYSGGGPTSEDPVQVVISGPDMAALRNYAEKVKEWLALTPGAVEIKDNLGRPRLDIGLKPDREALDFFQVTAQSLGAQLFRALEGEEVGKLPSDPGDPDIAIRVSYLWPSRGGEPGRPGLVSELAMACVQNPRGETVPLLSLIRLEEGLAPLVITHEAARRTVVVGAKCAGRTAGEIFADLSARLAQSPPPGGVSWRFGGEAESSAEAYGAAGRMFGVTVFLVFAVLVLQTRSFKQPLVILLTLPMALIGVVAAFLLAGLPFSFPAMIGVISLTGIAVNDAIVLIDTMNHLRREGAPLLEAAAKGASDRLRPVLVTTITTVAGLTPLMISDPMWRPLCLAIVGGLITATVITLVLAPCLYVLLLGKTPGNGEEASAEA